MSVEYTAGPGSGGGAAIGSPISGGTPTELLYVDASGNLAQTAQLSWYDRAGAFPWLPHETGLAIGDFVTATLTPYGKLAIYNDGSGTGNVELYAYDNNPFFIFRSTTDGANTGYVEMIPGATQTYPYGVAGSFCFSGSKSAILRSGDNQDIYIGHYRDSYTVPHPAISIINNGQTSVYPFVGIGKINPGTLLDVNGTVTGTDLIDSGLTITRIPFASTAGLLIDDSNFIYTAASHSLQNTGQTTFIAGAAATIPLTIQGAVSQSGNLQTWQDSTPTLLAFVNKTGGGAFEHIGVGKGSGTLGNGQVPTTTSCITVSESFTHTSSLRFAIQTSPTYSGAGTGNMSVTGAYLSVSWAGTQGSTGACNGVICSAGTSTTDVNLTTLRGAQFISQHTRAGTVATQVGGLFQTDNQGTNGVVTTQYCGQFTRSQTGTGGSVGTSYGAYIGNVSGSSGTVTNNYGLYLEAQTRGGTINYSIYSAGGKVNLSGLPTSSAGLSSGDLWVDTTGGLNILKVV